ncbi:hypothetical protein [Methylobacterium tardum]|uniref:hypothetical protein n=1 Tax=Methylobacterium tardum TaxID=374432 RepID=UPI001EE135EF|nr:hypothetical protein [Methylobacterium tardum]URD37892.1 hypothetical protein M6G65_05090 [Methylobacterium tardum]
MAALVILLFWTISGRGGDIVLFVFLAFLIANSFYILISRPTVKTSDILARASTGLALASLELQHQSQEAAIREVEAEERRLSEEENSQFKLQIAKDILDTMQSKLPVYRHKTEALPKITNQMRQKTHALPLLSTIPVAAENVRLSNGHDAGEKPTPPVIQASPAPSTAASK